MPVKHATPQVSAARLSLMAWKHVAAVRLYMWVFGWPRLYRKIPAWASRRPQVGPELFDICKAVHAAGPFFPGGGNCLIQAVAGYILLRRMGHGVELKIGVDTHHAKGFRAHAWVEHESWVVIGGGTRDHIPLSPIRFPDHS